MKYVDLSHELQDGAQVYPGDVPFVLSEISTVSEVGYSDFNLSSGLHVGTHIDAPGHMLEGGKYLNDFPIDRFIGRVICVDVRNVKVITAMHLKSYDIIAGDSVVLHTGFSEHYDGMDYFTKYPVLQEDAAKWLTSRKINMLGMDTPSPDFAPYDIHKILFEKDILLIENLNIQEELPYNIALTMWALPMHLKASAAFARIVIGVPGL